jgi:hypothetical protein
MQFYAKTYLPVVYRNHQQSCSILFRENSLFDTTLKCGSLFDTEQLFLPYMTLCLKFVPYMTFRPILPLTVLNDTWKDIVALDALSDKNGLTFSNNIPSVQRWQPAMYCPLRASGGHFSKLREQQHHGTRLVISECWRMKSSWNQTSVRTS